MSLASVHQVHPLPASSAALPTGSTEASGATLWAEGVTKRFGGVTAVNRVSLSLRPGEVHGLIGTNGSGKTTMLNLLSGYYPIDEGSISLGGVPLTSASVQRRPRAGIARSFQKPRLLGTLSVLDNAMLGGWKDTRAGFLQTAFASPRARREEAMLRARATDMLHGIGLGHLLHRKANQLDHAEQRFLEIARCLVMQPRFILLDEPAGGLTEHEIEQLGRIILTLRDAQVGVLIVEHHTDFVFRVCSRVTTLNLGKLLKDGTPDEVRNDPEVIRVYLGA